MPIANGTRFGPYEIVSELGAGGMGEVYAARDTRLDRAVAIKVLPASFANDADRLRRFEQEARATSALNHPNILTVYDIGSIQTENGGSPYIVAELLEGEELRAHLPPQSEAGALPVRKALDYAQQIAAGLAAAHEKGIVHRDLKPENLFVTKDGRVKILDFGLAKLKPSRIDGVDSQAPTQKRITDPGVVMGTVGYMSPEQVRGQEADHRADIFSFGVILYEMLSGRRTFTGDSAADVMSAILKEEPPELGETNAKISPALDKIVRRCLEKKPEHRFHSAHDLGFALEASSTPSSSGANRMEAALALNTSATAKGGGWRERIAWIVAGITTLALLALGVAYFRRPALEAEPMRFSITPPDKATYFDWPTISPDGRTLAFVANVEGKMQLWVRPLNSTIAKPLVELSNNFNWLFWSPDGRALGFFDDSKLKKITLAGGTPETLCEVNGSSGGAWSREGVILFGAGRRGLKRISAAGGTITDVTTVDVTRGERNHIAPVFLPDGRHFLFYLVNDDPAKNGVYLASLEGGESRQPLSIDSRTFGLALNPAATNEGWLVFTRQGALLAQPFDFRRNQLMGERVPLAGQARVDALGRTRLSVAANGMIVFIEGSANEQLVWLDRTGKRLGTAGQPGLFLGHVISPDEQRLVTEKRDPQTLNSDLYVWDLERGTETRFTFDPANDAAPVWSPDGSRIAWCSNREGVANLYQKAASGAGQDELLLKSAYSKFPIAWAPDGKFLLYRETNPQTNADFWVLPMEGERKPWPWLNTPFAEAWGQFAPNGKWIAYQSNESGRYEIYVQTFAPGAAASGDKKQISINGGVDPHWRRDGRELYYRSLDSKLMAVDVTLGAEMKAGTPRELFSMAGFSDLEATGDGQRFLVVAGAADRGVSPFTVVLNWMAELKK
ncbi:MAG: Serine/threonine-protein kinase PknD [Acidobacteria bacterium]|nr:Serine/threonine-protein kinase PknD [Acidobacteriota bacterium]